ncbi:MAG: phosphatase PAP2 family protein [Desulfovibrionaceae bacterium]|nr:phosphatase PAP2 family protein [Desulfovibrionaceae bacterium]
MFLSLDIALFRVLNGRVRSATLDAVLPLFSDAWIFYACGAVFVLGYAWYCRRRYGEALARVCVLVLLLGLSAGVADVSCNLIKDQVGRHRPFQTEAGTHFFTSDRQWTVIDKPSYRYGSTGGSFPSSHAATSMAATMVLALLFRRSRPWIFALPLLVAWSRLYVGKHFPVDVVAGWGVGVVSALAVWWSCQIASARFFRR